MAAATANVNASTRWDLCHAATVQLGMPTTEQRAAKVGAVLSMNGCYKWTCICRGKPCIHSAIRTGTVMSLGMLSIII